MIKCSADRLHTGDCKLFISATGNHSLPCGVFRVVVRPFCPPSLPLLIHLSRVGKTWNPGVQLFLELHFRQISSLFVSNLLNERIRWKKEQPDRVLPVCHAERNARACHVRVLCSQATLHVRENVVSEFVTPYLPSFYPIQLRSTV